MAFANDLGKGRRTFFSRERTRAALKDALYSWQNPITRNSSAFKDGRTGHPQPPEWAHDELLTRTVNLFLGTHYTVVEIQNMPEAWLDKMQLLASAMNPNESS